MGTEWLLMMASRYKSEHDRGGGTAKALLAHRSTEYEGCRAILWRTDVPGTLTRRNKHRVPD